VNEFTLFLAPIALLIIIFLSVQDWKNSIKVVLVLVVIEGALRKWFLPQASQFIYFLKDIVLLGAYLRYYFLSSTKRSFHIRKSSIQLLACLIFPLVIWCLFQAFNPSLGSPIVGFFGLRGYLFYIPLAWMLPNLFDSEDELYRFLRAYLLLIIPVGTLGVLQFFSPPSSLFNVYAGDTEVATFGYEGSTSVRVTGTFSYIAGYSVYLIVSFGLLVPLLTIHQSRWWRWITVVELVLVVANSFMNGSRSVIYNQILFLVGYLGVQVLTQPSIATRLVQRFALPAIAVTAASTIWFQSAITAFSQRVGSNEDASGRIIDLVIQPLEFVKFKGLDSYGVGATHQATPALRNVLNLPAGEEISVYYESESGRIMLEIGPLGFVFWYLLRLVLIILLWSTFLRLKRPFLRQLALVACLLHAILFVGQLAFNHTLLVYYWFLAGFIFLLPRLEQIEDWKEEQEFLLQ
jgi:hypothetical protein